MMRFGAAAAMAQYAPSPLAAELSRIEFSFIQLTDTHLSRRRLYSERQGYDVPSEESIRRSRAVVADINQCKLPYEMIVHTGDLAETRDTVEDYDLAQEILQFDAKTVFLPGNHDVGYSETPRYRAEFDKRFGRCDYTLEPVPGLRFAFFDSQPLDPRCGDQNREAAFQALEKMLAEQQPTILFCHAMGLESFYLNRLFPGWPQKTMDRWTKIMNAAGVFALIAGHFHRDEHHLVDGIPFYLAGPVINFWGRQTSYRHWRLSGGALSYRTVYLDI
jgi:hypothetical protein